MEFTMHAEGRIRQRGISQEVLDVIMEFGQLDYANGATLMHMSKQSINNYLKYSDMPNYQITSKLKKTYLVECQGKVLTAAHKRRSWRRKFK